jgi:assimilatory nitrate reductase catalytic subunit
MDAAALGVEHAGLVRLSNPRGAVLLRAQITTRQRRGGVFAPIHWTDQFASAARVDVLVAAHVDPLSGQPESKGTPVAVAPFLPAWHAFVLTRAKPEPLDCAYWALARIDGGWRAELAGAKALVDFEAFARKILGLAAGESDIAAMRDASNGGFRCVATRDGEILGAVYVAREPVAAARAWLCEQFTGNADPRALLAGRPPRGARDPGRKICVCMNVGANTILDAIRRGGLSTADAVGQKTNAGTGCGSCKPEIERLLIESPQFAAE